MSYEPSLAVIIRASGESTLPTLISIVNKQLLPNDCLEVLDEEVSFEEKLKYGFAKAIEFNKDYTVFIDADILIRKNALRRTRQLSKKMGATQLGFGFLVWDRFYDNPKFRGYHVYRTNLLPIAQKFIPDNGMELRPESYVKKKMCELGYQWFNNTSHYIVGLHDFYQNPKDIYYKYLIRSKRSGIEVKELKKKLKKNSHISENRIALQGLMDGEKMQNITNNKFLYKDVNIGTYSLNIKNVNVDLILLKKIWKRYGIGKMFWKSL